jgi:hypothetical protein
MDEREAPARAAEDHRGPNATKGERAPQKLISVGPVKPVSAALAKMNDPANLIPCG